MGCSPRFGTWLSKIKYILSAPSIILKAYVEVSCHVGIQSNQRLKYWLGWRQAIRGEVLGRVPSLGFFRKKISMS